VLATTGEFYRRSFLMFTLMCALTVKPHEPCLAPFWGACSWTQAMLVSNFAFQPQGLRVDESGVECGQEWGFWGTPTELLTH